MGLRGGYGAGRGYGVVMGGYGAGGGLWGGYGVLLPNTGGLHVFGGQWGYGVMGIYGSLWSLNGTVWDLWVYGSLWVSMGSLWVCMGSMGFLWVSIGSVWVSMGSQWVCM